jgi:hypothetical protein
VHSQVTPKLLAQAEKVLNDRGLVSQREGRSSLLQSAVAPVAIAEVGIRDIASMYEDVVGNLRHVTLDATLDESVSANSEHTIAGV